MMDKIKKILSFKKLILTFILLVGTVSIFLHFSIIFNADFSSKNKKAYKALKSLSNYPEGLVLLSSKKWEGTSFNNQEINIINGWINDDEYQSLIKVTNNNLFIKKTFSNDFKLSNFIGKLLLIPDANIRDISLNSIEQTLEINIQKN